MPMSPKRTEVNDAKFFAALENGHSVRAACAASGYTRQVVYRWRKDAAFDARWRMATTMGGDLLEEEADRRGRDGIDHPVYFRGQEAGAKRKFSDGLLLARLKAIKPEAYRERVVVQSDVPRPINVIVRDFNVEAFVMQLVEQGRVSLEEVPQTLRANVEKRLNDKRIGV